MSEGEPFSLDTPRCRPPPINTQAVAAAVAQSLTEPRNEPIIFDEELFVLGGEAVTARGYEEDTSLADAVRMRLCPYIHELTLSSHH
jgi:hypothetical protein